MGSNSIAHLVTRYVNPVEIKNRQVIDLYDEYASNLGTNYLNINLQPGSVQPNGNFIGITPIPLHRSSRYLWEMMPAGYDEAFLRVEYYYGIKGFDPEEKLTLREFFIRTLDIWDGMLPKLDTPHWNKDTSKMGPSKAATDLITAMEVLKDTYMLNELMDTWRSPHGVEYNKGNMEDFKALFNVPKIAQLTAGPTAGASEVNSVDSDPTGVK